MQPQMLGNDYDYEAPDGAEIRLLPSIKDRGGLCHATWAPGQISKPVVHKSVHEIWYCLEGHGEFWSRDNDSTGIDFPQPGFSFVINPGQSYQVRNSGVVPLKFLIATMPEWPGPDEATPCQGIWTRFF